MNGIDASGNYTSPDDARLKKVCNMRRTKLTSFVDIILNGILDARDKYPVAIQIICCKLRELASTVGSDNHKNENLSKLLVNAFIFEFIFRPKILIYCHQLSKKEKNNGKKNVSNLRRRSILISKVRRLFYHCCCFLFLFFYFLLFLML